MDNIQLSSSTLSNLSSNHAIRMMSIDLSNVHTASLNTSVLANTVSTSQLDEANGASSISCISSIVHTGPINTQNAAKESDQDQRSATKKTHGQTGPKSRAGKKAIRFNALKTGQHAKSTLLPFEDEKAYAKHLKEVFSALAPANYIEAQIADEYANALWRILRHETRGVYEREKILERLTPQMAAQMLGISGHRATRAPEYLTQLRYVVSQSERLLAKKGLQEYAHLIEHAKGIQNFNLVWRQYPTLFEVLATWIDAQQIKPTLFGPSSQGLSMAWQQNPNKILSYLEELADELYYLANWELMRPQIRIWMEAYYFSQRTEQHRINQDEQLLMKERNYAHSLLDRLMRQRKSGFLWNISSVDTEL